MNIVPAFLKPGDLVLIIATARARDLEAIGYAIQTLRDWGFRVELGKHALKRHHQFAGTDQERTEDLQWALDHPEAKAILISGGGYGALRIIDRIYLEKFRLNPKWVVGYSDTTVLHARLLKAGYCSIHGPMAFQFSAHAEATDSVRKLLCGEQVRYDIRPDPSQRSGRALGELVGGNLSLIYALSGSIDEIDTRGKILLLEDLDEQLYHIDRMMLQLKRSGKLAELAGLVVGGFTEMKDNLVPFGKTAEEIIAEAVQEFKYPVCFHFPAGHIEKNMAVYLGMPAALSVAPPAISLKF